MQLETNRELELAEEFLRSTSTNIFLTGKAGTGKSTFLLNMIKNIPKRLIVAAPTGVAALNVGGVTLHSLFQLSFAPYIPNSSQTSERNIAIQKISKKKRGLIRSIEVLVIDEISMVRSDVLDAIDDVLRRIRRSSKAFGGVQLLLIGDIQQLSPICANNEWSILKDFYKSPYFFDSNALKKCSYITVELKKIFRQKDKNFTKLLNSIRENNLDTDALNLLNKRYIPNFTPANGEEYITLCTHNRSADSINVSRLSEIKTNPTSYRAKIEKDFSEYLYPNESLLKLKIGAQVMFIKNDPSPEKLYYNGMIAKVISLEKDSVMVRPTASDKNLIITPLTWDNIEYSIDKDSGEVKENIKGTYTQIPLKCAWAITIHKSQGLSFDKAIIDAQNSFAYGQVYVALSRCRSLEGLVLSSPLNASSIVKDPYIDGFNNDVVSREIDSTEIEKHKCDYFTHILNSIFNFYSVERSFYNMSWVLNANLRPVYPKLCEKINVFNNSILKDEILKVGDGFNKQLSKIIIESNNYNTDELLIERLNKASKYFLERISLVEEILYEVSSINIDATDIKKRINNLYQECIEDIIIRKAAMELCLANDFSIEKYLKTRVLIINSVSKKRKESSVKNKSTKVAEDIIHKQLYTELVAWRLKEAHKIEKPAFTILSNKVLVQIQDKLPRSGAELKSINGMGDVKLQRFGKQILDIIDVYCESIGIGEF